jgi:transcriptional regulator NrdR family protein
MITRFGFCGGERRSTAEPAPWAVGEPVMEALSTADPVAYGRIALVYRNFREAKVFWQVPRVDRGG